MKEFDKLTWGFIFSIIGISTGWFLNQISQWLNIRQKEKGSLKNIIFNLLEINHWLIRCDFDKIQSTVSSKILERIPKKEQSPEMIASFNKYINSMVQDFLKPQIFSQIEEMEENYISAINELSFIAPFSAYYLNGKTKIFKKFEKLREWYSSLKNENPMETNAIEAGEKKAFSILNSEFLRDAIKDLESEIISLSWKVSFSMWLRARSTLKQMKRGITVELEDKLNQFFDDLKSNSTHK